MVKEVIIGKEMIIVKEVIIEKEVISCDVSPVAMFFVWGNVIGLESFVLKYLWYVRDSYNSMVKFSSLFGELTLIDCKGSAVLPWSPYPIHHSFLLFPWLEASLFFLVISCSNASLLVISWSNNASSFPPPLCHRADHHQGHPESLQENIFWSAPSATSGLVSGQALQNFWNRSGKEPDNSLLYWFHLHPKELDQTHPKQVCHICWISDEP